MFFFCFFFCCSFLFFIQTNSLANSWSDRHELLCNMAGIGSGLIYNQRLFRFDIIIHTFYYYHYCYYDYYI